jgi:hypothetical protein
VVPTLTVNVAGENAKLVKVTELPEEGSEDVDGALFPVQADSIIRVIIMNIIAIRNNGRRKILFI